MDEPTRRAWSEPELIVLVRGREEEAVLASCKKAGSAADNASSYQGCDFAPGAMCTVSCEVGYTS